MEYILTAKDLIKEYRHSAKALNRFSIHVPKGAIYGFVGENGAGKTTFIRMVCGLQAPTSGSYTLYGVKNADKNILNSQKRIGAVVETPSIYMDMTAKNNLKQQYQILGLPSYDGIDELLHLVGLDSVGKKKVKHGYLKLLENEECSEVGRTYLIAIENRTKAMKQLTEELFQYTLTVSDTEEMIIETVNLNGILESCISSYYSILKQNNITPQITIPNKRILGKGNENALSRILGNIISNAVKYSDGDLKIILTENRELLFSNHASGLTEIQVERLFDRFYTVNNARKSTGLGLSISKVLIEKMGGTISAKYENDILTIKISIQEK